MVRLAIAGLAAFVGAALVTPAAACPVCIERPEATLADRLLSADVVAIAREDPDRPFRFAPVAVLAGSVEGLPRPPLLVDSATRRRLAAGPEDGVLLLHEGDGWARAAHLDPAAQGVVAEILARGPAWRNEPEARFAFFEPLLHHRDRTLRHLAMDELSRGRYGLIRRMARPIDGETARQALADRSLIPWQAFHILMLGLSERAEDRAFIRARVATAARLGGDRELDAWATALIEIDGAVGVATLVREWLETPGRDVEALRAVLTAFSIHARDGDPALRPGLLAALHALPRRRPDVGGSVAAALGEIGDFSQGAAIERIMLDAARRGEIGLRDPELMAAAFYVHRARQRIPEETDAASGAGRAE